MTPRTLLMTLLGLTFTAASAVAQTPQAPTPDPTVNQRLENQKDRIQAGIKDDQLTKAEATKVRADDAAIRARAKVDRQANDGKLTAGEKQQLDHELNQTSRQIHRARHNDRKPKA
jgi:hypothetical protein